MNSRLIPWCLAATGFLATITALAINSSGWWDSPEEATPLVELSAARRGPVVQTMDRDRWPGPSRDSATAPGAAQNAPPQLVLPLPPATQAEPPGDVQPVADDEPTVDDLAGRQAPSP